MKKIALFGASAVLTAAVALTSALPAQALTIGSKNATSFSSTFMGGFSFQKQMVRQQLPDDGNRQIEIKRVVLPIPSSTFGNKIPVAAFAFLVEPGVNMNELNLAQLTDSRARDLLNAILRLSPYDAINHTDRYYEVLRDVCDVLRLPEAVRSKLDLITYDSANRTPNVRFNFVGDSASTYIGKLGTFSLPLGGSATFETPSFAMIFPAIKEPAHLASDGRVSLYLKGGSNGQCGNKFAYGPNVEHSAFNLSFYIAAIPCDHP